MFLQKTGDDLRKNSQPDPYSMDKPSGYYLFLLTLTATLGGLLFGYDTAVISGTVASLKDFFIEPFNWPETVANSRHGLVISSALIGCIVGALTGGLISKYLGRKKGLQLAAILFLISALGSAMPEIFFRPVGQADHTFIMTQGIYYPKIILLNIFITR